MNTFQKYYEQQELQQFIEDVLETTATPVGLGVFYVFRDPADQQDFLSARSRRAIDWNQISARLGLGAPAADRWEGLYAEHQELLSSPAGGSRRSWLARIGLSGRHQVVLTRPCHRATRTRMNGPPGNSCSALNSWGDSWGAVM